MKPGDGCSNGTKCCVFIGEARGRWFWDTGLGFGESDVGHRDGILKSEESLPDELLHIYASLVLENALPKRER